MNRLEELFTTFPSFTCEEITDKANDFSENFVTPITFTQIDFWIFFALAYFGFALVYNRKHLKTSFLILASCFFYFKTSGLFVAILVFSTIVDYFIGGGIGRSKVKWKRGVLLAISVSINLFVLCYFKYAYFFTESANALLHTSWEPFNYFAHWANGFAGSEIMCVDKIVLPIGISFYTFQTMSYSLDIYRGDLKPTHNILDFATFVTFFPQLVAGPIVRAKDFIPQINAPFKITKRQFSICVWIILGGLIKKIVFADYIAVNFVDRVVDDPWQYPGFVNMVAMWGYSLQIYGDFAGYTDIAIGVSGLMGFNIGKNFNSPYKAENVGDFWRRWHISLSSWLRDYLYIPLGGKYRASIASYIFIPLIIAFMGGIANYYFDFNFWVTSGIFLGVTGIALFIPAFRVFVSRDINLLITMLLGGLWHGPSLKFIIWGGLNGIGLVIYKYWKRISPFNKANYWVRHIWGVFITFNFITLTRVYFRAQDMNRADGILEQIWYDFSFSWSTFTEKLLGGYPMPMIVLLVGMIVHWLPGSLKDGWRDRFANAKVGWQVAFVVLVIVFIYQFVSADFVPFVYFQF